MIEKFRFIWQLLVLYVLLMLCGILILNYTSIPLPVNTYALTLSVMTLITLTTYILVQAGVSRGVKEQGIFLLIGLGTKFLFYLIFILIFWATGKNLTKPFIIAFFILYLFLTFFLVRALYKMLKSNWLDQVVRLKKEIIGAVILLVSGTCLTNTTHL